MMQTRVETFVSSKYFVEAVLKDYSQVYCKKKEDLSFVQDLKDSEPNCFDLLLAGKYCGFGMCSWP